MNIPHLTKDLAVIQKLSDLPNTADGLSAAALKAKFDEAALAIQSWLNNTFIPALKAENIPFTGSAQLDAENIQTAIQMVFEQVRDASSGTIVNGSVTKAKLAEELLERVFGGRAWVSLDKPTADHSPEQEFPVGQFWLRPGFTVTNAAEQNWSTSACTVEAKDDHITVTGNGDVAEACISQVFSDIGETGDRVVVLFGIKDKDSEITSLTATVGGVEQDAALGTYETVLAGKSLSVQFKALWPAASLATGSFTIENLAVVNIDQIMRQTYDCKEMADWGGFLKALLPLSSYDSPRELYIQTDAGLWQQFDFEIFPAERGGTGLDAVGTGEMLYGSGSSKLNRLAAAETEHSLLQFLDGKPQWSAPEEVAESTSFARVAEGTYEGTGKAGVVELPGKAAVLWLRTENMMLQFFQGVSASGRYDGTYKYPNGGEYETKYNAGVTLNGTVLDFWFQTSKPEDSEWVGDDAVHLNEVGKTYTWTAIY